MLTIVGPKSGSTSYRCDCEPYLAAVRANWRMLIAARTWRPEPPRRGVDGVALVEAGASRIGCSAPLSLQVIGGTLGTRIAAWWQCRLVSAGRRAGRGTAAAGWPGSSARRWR